MVLYRWTFLFALLLIFLFLFLEMTASLIYRPWPPAIIAAAASAASSMQTSHCAYTQRTTSSTID